MNVVQCFIGPLPSYTITTIKQTRLFFDGPLYLITNDMTHSMCETLIREYQVLLVNYNDVMDAEFQMIAQQQSHRFRIVSGLKERSKLFLYSFERFFCLLHLMTHLSVDNVFFMELDNLIQKNPNDWLMQFQRHGLAQMQDGPDRCSSGIAYIRDVQSLQSLTRHCLDFIVHGKGFLSEMHALASYEGDVLQLPTHYLSSQDPKIYSNFPLFGSLFDAAAYGIYLGGLDPIHTHGVIKKGSKNQWSTINATQETYEWRSDSQGRKIPGIVVSMNWIPLNNLHIHSKQLNEFVS